MWEEVNKVWLLMEFPESLFKKGDIIIEGKMVDTIGTFWEGVREVKGTYRGYWDNQQFLNLLDILKLNIT